MIKICKNCGSYGEEKIRGHIAVEIILWIVTVCTAGLLIVISLPYSIWRRTGKPFCPKCGAPNMIPFNTPEGEELAKKYKLKVTYIPVEHWYDID